MSRRFRIFLVWMTSALALVTTQLVQARGIIKEPGRHPAYSVELEPHLVVGWQWAPHGAHTGFGPGLRVSIPFLDNGPIAKLNNNMAITFGFDWVHATHDCRVPGDPFARDCGTNSFWFPVALQWNFFFTEVISVFGEPGFAVSHDRWSRWERCGPNLPGPCEAKDSDTHLRPVLWGGARFLFGNTVALTVRVGIPSLSVGLSLLL